MSNNIEIKPVENNVFYETFGNHTRLELKNALAINKFIIALQKFDDNNKQTAFISAYVDVDQALVMANDILSGKYVRDAAKKPDEITTVFKAQGGTVKDDKIIYRDITLSKGRLWMFKAQECPGVRVEKGGFAPSGAPTSQVSVGVADETLKAIALMIQYEYIAYRTNQMKRA